MTDKKIELFGLSIGLSAVATLTFFLLFNFRKCIFPFEPHLWIRIPEIIMGLITIIIIWNIINDKIKK